MHQTALHKVLVVRQQDIAEYAVNNLVSHWELH